MMPFARRLRHVEGTPAQDAFSAFRATRLSLMAPFQMLRRHTPICRFLLSENILIIHWRLLCQRVRAQQRDSSRVLRVICLFHAICAAAFLRAAGLYYALYRQQYARYDFLHALR